MTHHYTALWSCRNYRWLKILWKSTRNFSQLNERNSRRIVRSTTHVEGACGMTGCLWLPWLLIYHMKSRRNSGQFTGRSVRWNRGIKWHLWGSSSVDKPRKTKEIGKDWKQSERTYWHCTHAHNLITRAGTRQPGQEIESVIAEMMSGQGRDGVKIYWEEEKDFWSVLKQTFQGRDVFLPPKRGGRG